MKKVSLVLAVMLLVAITATALAQVSYPNGWNTSYQIANLGDAAANIRVDYYDENGVSTASMSRDFPNTPIGGSVTILQATEATLGEGRWSAVVSADQPIAAVVNQQTDAGDGNSQPPFSSYSGAAEGSTSVLLPVVMYNWYNYYTEITIQNVGDAAASDIDIEFVPTMQGTCVAGASGVTIDNQSIAQYAGATYSQVDQTALGAPAAAGCEMYEGRFLGAAKITSDQPVVVVVNQHVQNKLFTYNGFSASGTSMLLPAYMRTYYGYYASLTIANPSTSASANVTITYSADAAFSAPASEVIVANHVVPAGGSVVRYDGDDSSADQSDLEQLYPIGDANRFFGSVKVESDVPVVAIVNQEALATAGAQAGTYNGLFSSEGTGKISIPLIQSGFYGYYTSLTIVSVDGTNPTVSITYTSDGSYSTVQNTTQSYNHTLANGFLNRYEGESGSAAQSDIKDDAMWSDGTNRRFIGSAVIEVVSGSDIVAFVNSEKSVDAMDSMYTYNAFNIE